MELSRVWEKEFEEIVEGLKGGVKERDGQLAACEKEIVVLLKEKESCLCAAREKGNRWKEQAAVLKTELSNTKEKLHLVGQELTQAQRIQSETSHRFERGAMISVVISLSTVFFPFLLVLSGFASSSCLSVV
mmetsp:Transcript_57103/g.68271  ORF Transcript_57103/g.68271 Transcript_57103/m.68271 type:complete len:132 (+) Transcript_57103:158-553(+)